MTEDDRDQNEAVEPQTSFAFEGAPVEEPSEAKPSRSRWKARKSPEAKASSESPPKKYRPQKAQKKVPPHGGTWRLGSDGEYVLVEKTTVQTHKH